LAGAGQGCTPRGSPTKERKGRGTCPHDSPEEERKGERLHAPTTRHRRKERGGTSRPATRRLGGEEMERVEKDNVDEGWIR